MNETFSLSLEEQGAILFTSAILWIGSVVGFALFLFQITSPGSGKLDCCCFNLCKLFYKKCCKCKNLNDELKKHLKDEEDD